MLTDKQKRFCEEYLIDLNATQAAIRAGYSEKSARADSSRMLTNANIQEYIGQRQKELASKTEITQERILKEYAKVAFFDIRKVYTETDSLKSIQDLDDESAGAIAGIEVSEETEFVNGKKEVTGHLKKLKIHNKISALDSLCKVLGFNAPDKVDMTTKGESLNGDDLSKLSNEEKLQLLKLKQKMRG